MFQDGFWFTAGLTLSLFMIISGAFVLFWLRQNTSLNINENQLREVIATGITLIILGLFGLVLTSVLAL